jgi:hypothetical protein
VDNPLPVHLMDFGPHCCAIQKRGYPPHKDPTRSPAWEDRLILQRASTEVFSRALATIL